MRRLAACLVACWMLPAAAASPADPLNAAPADPLESPACARGLAALQGARAPGSTRTAAEVEALRREATQACLGGNGEGRRPAPVAQAPIEIPTPAVALPRSVPPRLPVVPAPPLERPPVLISCDPGGCWDSNGTRLNRAGPLLIGPGGACVQSGLQVRCP